MSVRKDFSMWLVVGGVLVVVVAITLFFIASMMKPTALVRIGDGVFTAEIARTSDERERFLTDPSVDKALLAVYPAEGIYSVVMKDAKKPIDAVWLNKDRKVVHIVYNLTPDTYPRVFAPTKKAQYIVKLPAGSVQSRAIRVGSVASFDDEKAKQGAAW